VFFFPPSYSLGFNPDEYLNFDLKAGGHFEVPARIKKQLKKKAVSHLSILRKRPIRVKKHFKHPKIDYTA